MVPAASADSQAPTKVPFCFSPGAQLNMSPLAMFVSEKDGPESESSSASVGEDPGSILMRRNQFSIFHDWYCSALSVQTEVALAGVGTSLVAMFRLGRVPGSMLSGTQYVLPSAVVQLNSTFMDPVASPTDLLVLVSWCCNGRRRTK